MAQGYLQVPHALLRSGVDPILLRVYLVIASFADAGTRGECTAARETIAAAAGCSPASVKRAISALERMTWVYVNDRPGRPSVIHPVRPRQVDLTGIATNPGHTDPGAGHTDPTPGSHRPTKKTERRRRTEEDNPKTNAAGVRRAMSGAQLTMLTDIAVLLECSGDDSMPAPAPGTLTWDEADALIQHHWAALEHGGREDAAYAARRNPDLYARLSPQGRAFVDREDLTS